MGKLLAVFATLAILLVGCAAPASQTAPTPVDAEPSKTQLASPESSVGALAETPDEVHLLAVGDIADCEASADEEVAELVAGRRGRIALLGDTVYPSGTTQDFADCFDPAWGPMKSRIYPSVGNHEYQTEGAAGYFTYFGDRAGAAGKGWYSYNLGPSWRAIVLNSNCRAVGGCGADSPQGRWLASELEAVGDRNVLAYWHAPLYSSGEHGSIAAMRPFFRKLYRAGADIVLNGHDHNYERFAPQNADGERRPNGVQEFVVGTGGRSLYPFEDPPLPNTRVRRATTYGVLKLRLRADGYSWLFLPSRGSFTDSGSRTLP